MRLLAVWCVMLGLAGPAHADPFGEYEFRSFGGAEGLENHAVNAIAQSADGLLWVGTEDGLYRYDGARFHRFGTADGLPADEILALAPAAAGVWVGTVHGLAHVHRDRVDHVPSGGPADHVSAIATAEDGTVWAASDVGLFTGKEDAVALAPGWPAGPSNAVWLDAGGHVFAGHGRELATRTDDGRWRLFGSAEGFGRERIDQIAQTGDHTLWVRSARFLWRCDPKLTTCRELSGEFAAASEIGRLLVGRDGSLWVTTLRGLAHLTPSGWEILDQTQGLPVHSVLNAFEDREGSLWVAADQLYQRLGGGLWRAFEPSSLFPADTVWLPMRDHTGTLWLGSDRGIVEATASGWRTFPGTEASTVEAMFDSGDVLYAGDLTSRVFTLDRATRTTKLVAQLPGDGIMGILQHDGALYVATWNAGLWRLRDVAGTWQSERVAVPGGDEREDFNHLIHDRQGRLWAAGSAGLAVLDGTRWHRFTPRDGLAADAVDYLVARASGEMCVGYEDPHGVTCFRYADGLADVHQLTRASGLASDKVYLVGEDAAGRLYVGLGNGVDVVDRDAIEHFSTATGMSGDDCAARSFWRDPDGTVLIGSSHGLSRFDAAHYRGPSAIAAPIIVSATLGGEAVREGEPAPSIASEASSLVVHFATPTYANRTRLAQEVRLVPVETDWRVSPSDEVRYARLPPGDYRLEVRARGALGHQSAVTTFAFSVRPAWWQTLWVRASVSVLCVLLVAGVVIWRGRVTDRRASARAVARSEASFKRLIEQSPDAVIVHRDGFVVYANPRTLALLGFRQPDEVVGKSVLDLYEGADHADMIAGWSTVLATGEPLPVRELSLVGAGGRSVLVEVSTLRVDFDGAAAILAIGRDRSERKALEARLMFSDRMASIGTLAAGVAHEVNNPLAYLKANIIAVAEELAEQPASQTVRAALADALDGAQRVETIVRSIKTFSRIEGEERTPVDIHAALEAALRMTANELRHRCRVIMDFGPVPKVLANEARLGQVFVNLLINAAQAMPDRPHDANEVTIVTRTGDAGSAVISIRDNGTGMTPEVMRRAFEPFFTTKDVGQGTGLGLAVCHGIVQSLAGEISVESQPGAGSTFRVVLPGTSAAAGPVEPTSTPIAPLRRRVLVIDDDEKMLASIGRMLRKDNDVTLLSSARAALDLFETGTRFDVVLCDVMMPGFTGMELHLALEQRHPDIAARTLFMTGGAFTTEARTFVARADVASLEKPFEPAELRQRIQAIASRADDAAAAAR